MRFAALRTGDCSINPKFARDAASRSPPATVISTSRSRIPRFPFPCTPPTGRSIDEGEEASFGMIAAWGLARRLRSPGDLAEDRTSGIWFEQALFQTFHPGPQWTRCEEKLITGGTPPGMKSILSSKRTTGSSLVEIKSSSTVAPADAKNLHVFGRVARQRARPTGAVYSSVRRRHEPDTCKKLHRAFGRLHVPG